MHHQFKLDLTTLIQRRRERTEPAGVQGEGFAEGRVQRSLDDARLLRLLSGKQVSRLQLDDDVRVA